MKFTLSWLKRYLDTAAPPQALADKLTALGLEVEAIADEAARLKDFRVAEILETKPHPNADRLKLCMVNIGTAAPVEVVCGAPNARAGLKTPYACEGVVIPRSGQPLKAATIRGVVSNGMLCSEDELQLPVTLDGIMELPAGAKVGASLPAALGLDDPVFTIKLTPNRPDCTGIYGIARDLAAAGMGKLKPIAIPKEDGEGLCPQTVLLESDACSYFVGCTITGVSNGESPLWLQHQLKAIGLRPISALVDITNFFTHAFGRPLHVFDADKITGALRVRESRAGESFKALNNESYTLPARLPVLADDRGVLGLAGVMGGEASGCSPATKNVFLEVAYFTPARIAAAGRALNLQTDARYRFERGVDPAFVKDGAILAVAMIREFCGGTASELKIVGKEPVWQRNFRLRPSRVETLGGLAVPKAEQERRLTALGFTVKTEGVEFRVAPPSWRGDVVGEADLVEEILRLGGYDDVKPVLLPPRPLPLKAYLTERMTKTIRVRRALAEAGLYEAVTWSFLYSAKAAKFGAAPESLKLLNPISADLDQMRPSILPNLMAAARRNADRGYKDVGLFEVGPVYTGTGEKDQATQAAILRAGSAAPRHWGLTARAVDAFDVKRDALTALAAAGMNVDGVQVKGDAPAHYHPGRSGTLWLGPLKLAAFGEIHPALCEEYGLETLTAAAEIFLDAVPSRGEAAGGSGGKKPLQLAALQPLERDFAFLLAAETPAEKLLSAIRGVDRALIRAASVFDVYEGKGVPAGQKSLAVSVVLQPTEKTLTDADLAELSTRIVAAVAKATGGSLRT